MSDIDCNVVDLKQSLFIQAVCSRCKNPYKSLSGESVLLCNICYWEREVTD